MAARLHQTERARADLIDIWLHVAADSPAAADRLFDRLEARVRSLDTFPQSGPARPDIAPDARMLVASPYVILYRLVPEGVQVVRVLHGARHIDALLFAAGVE